VRTGNGPFERAVGAAAIRALAVRDGGPALARALAGSADLTPLFEAVTAGDPAALGVLDTVAARFARGLAAYLLLVDPARVVIGGGLAHAGEPLLAALRRHLGPLVLVPFDLRVSALRENAVVAGAVRMALGTAEHRLAMQVSASRD
jgi:predicted NBD/HSP70 family sugar kinase